MLGMGTGTTLTTGTDCICIGYQANVNAPTRTNCLVIGSNAFSAGNNSTVLSLNYLQTTAGGLQTLQIDAATGEIRRNTSSMRYKDPLPDPVDGVNCYKLLNIKPRMFTMKNDENKTPRLGYYAEEVESIVDDDGKPAFIDALNYTMLNDKRTVDGVNYHAFVIYIIELLKKHEARIAELEAKLN